MLNINFLNTFNISKPRKNKKTPEPKVPSFPSEKGERISLSAINAYNVETQMAEELGNIRLPAGPPFGEGEVLGVRMDFVITKRSAKNLEYLENIDISQWQANYFILNPNGRVINVKIHLKDYDVTIASASPGFAEIVPPVYKLSSQFPANNGIIIFYESEAQAEHPESFFEPKELFSETELIEILNIS